MSADAILAASGLIAPALTLAGLFALIWAADHIGCALGLGRFLKD